MPNPQIKTITADGVTYDIVDKTSGYAPLDSPALTGTPTAPTAVSGTDTTQIATTAFVQDAIAGMGTGSVTSVGVQNATNGGISVSGSPITSSGTITIGHSNVLTNAQTTQAVYPIKIDKNGHISEYGSAVTIPTVPENTGSAETGISIADHSTSTIYGVGSSTTSVTGVQSSTTTASHVKSGGNGTAPTLGDAISVPNVTEASDVTVPIRADSATTVPTAASSATTVPIKDAEATSIPNVTSVGSASTWAFENVTVPIRADSATSIPNVTSAGSASTWAFEDITVPVVATADTTVPIADTSATSIPNVTAVGSGSFTQGSFTGGSITVTNHVLSFTPATHGADSHTHTAPTLGTAISVTGVSGSTSVRGVKTGTSSTTTASHVTGGANGSAPTLGTAISIYGVKSGTNSTTTASHVTSGANGTAPTLGDPISIIGVQSSTTSVTGVSGSTSVYGVKSGTNSTTTASKVTLGTAISVPNITSVGSASNWVFEDITVPIKDASATTVPIKNADSTTVVTSKTHSITDNGHTHSI